MFRSYSTIFNHWMLQSGKNCYQFVMHQYFIVPLRLNAKQTN